MSDTKVPPEGNAGEETVESLKAKLAEKEAAITSMSGELATDRAKRQGLEGERDALKTKLTEAEAKLNGNQETPAQAVERILNERTTADAGKNREAAEAAFKKANSEFHPDNDPGGIKFQAVKDKLGEFNLDGLVTTEEFLARFDSAYTLLNGKKPQPVQITPYAATPSQTSSGPREADDDNLTTQEKDVLARIGWTKEKYIEQMKKRPQYVRSLFKSFE